jgi:paraquat-inducible protein A
MPARGLIRAMPAPLIACHECDLLQREGDLAPGAAARCRRCSATLYRRARHRVDHTLAWVLTASVLFVIANAYPLVGLELGGQHTSATLPGAARALHEQGRTVVAALVLGTTVVAPGIALAAMLYLLVPLSLGRLAPGFVPLARLVQTVSPWGMFEVFMLGIVVALVKLAHVATVTPGVGLWAYAGLMFAFIAAAASYDSHRLWTRVATLEAAGR